jgi:hypothetical protein
MCLVASHSVNGRLYIVDCPNAFVDNIFST